MVVPLLDTRRGAVSAMLALCAMAATAAPVAAECVFVPPWPPITNAIPTAQEIVIGRVVSDFDPAELVVVGEDGPRETALRVTEVLRGERRPGDLLYVERLLPGWPVHRTSSGTLLASCTYLGARDGELIALALNAFQPSVTTEADGVLPATRYHAVGLIESTRVEGFRHEVVTADEVRALAALPHTDTVDRQGEASISLPSMAALAAAIAFAGALVFGSRLVARARRT